MKSPLIVSLSLMLASFSPLLAADDTPKIDSGGKTMTEEPKMTATEFHKQMAVDLFNATWDLVDKKDRTPEDDEMMLLRIYASTYHWSVVGGHENMDRGNQMISHVYALLGRGEPALYHAQRALAVIVKYSIGDWDAAFVYEAMARAYAVLGNKAEFEKYYQIAKDAGEKIKEKGDRDYFYEALEQGPWYGMK